MRLADVIELRAGGPGSGCNPQKARCGRKTSSSKGKNKSVKAKPESKYQVTGPLAVQYVLPRHEISLQNMPSKSGGPLHSDVLMITGPKLHPKEEVSIVKMLRREGFKFSGVSSSGSVYWNSKSATRLEIQFLKRGR